MVNYLIRWWIIWFDGKLFLGRITCTTFMTTMRLRGREAIISKRDPIVSSREQIPGPSSQTEQKQMICLTNLGKKLQYEYKQMTNLWEFIHRTKDLISYLETSYWIFSECCLPSWIIEKQWVRGRIYSGFCIWRFLYCREIRTHIWEIGQVWLP